jgi:sugar transferase (PEP-CTERM/EpsH1 system associated)
MKRILIVSFRFPYPLTDGSRMHIFHLSRCLARQYEVDLLSINEGGIEYRHRTELEKIFHRVIVYPFHPLRFKINTLRGLFSSDSLQVFYHYFNQVQRWIDENYRHYDLIFCFHIRMTRYLRHIKDRPKLIDFMDATSLLYQEAQERATGLWKVVLPIENRRSLAYELRMMGEFEKAFISSPYDKAYLDRSSGRANPHLVFIPNGVKEELLLRQNRLKEEDLVVFLGKMNYAPNVDAVAFFAREVLPLLRKRKDLRFCIVGTHPSPEVLRLGRQDGIEVTGFLEDPYPYLERAKVVVVPLRFGAGFQNKVIEAMALRRAVVTTSKAVRGIEGEDGKHFMVADGIEQMVSKILALMEDEDARRAMGERARQLVEERYQWGLIEDRFLKEVEEVFDRKGKQGRPEEKVPWPSISS